MENLDYIKTFEIISGMQSKYHNDQELGKELRKFLMEINGNAVFKKKNNSSKKKVI